MNVNYSLNSKELKKALKMLAKLGGKKENLAEEIVLEFQESGMDITFNGMTMSVSGKGKGSGRARIRGVHIQVLAKLSFKEKTTRVLVEDAKLQVGTFLAHCQWTDISPPLIQLPMDPPLLDILAIGRKYDESQILASGLMPKVKEAEKKKNDIIAEAVAKLKETEEKKNDIIAEAVAKLKEAEEKKNDLVSEAIAILRPLEITGKDLIPKAATILLPLEITEKDLEDLIDSEIAKRRLKS